MAVLALGRDEIAAAVARGLAAARDPAQPGDAGRSPQKYAQLSDDFRASAWRHLDQDGDLPQASGKAWGLVAETIRGRPVGEALITLAHSRRRIAGDVRKCLQSAIANAENNHELDVDRLFVAETMVGKGLVMKRWRPRARGRVGRIKKPFSHLTIVVRERAKGA